MAGDTIPLLDLLRNRFGGKTHVAGFSFGTTVGEPGRGVAQAYPRRHN
jgi:hypothetical protein